MPKAVDRWDAFAGHEPSTSTKILPSLTSYFARSSDVDLNIAMKEAVREAVELLQAKAGVTAAEAYAIASMGVDFRVAEAVDSMLLIYGVVPKKFFKQNPAYWGAK